MARQLRIEYEGAIYHVMSRGDRREAIFLNDEDRQLFLKTLEKSCAKAGWLIHAYVLMGNHFHLVVETPQPTLVSGMKWFLGTYTQRFNARHQLRGHLFSGRYKSLLVDGANDYYLRVVCDYVHLRKGRSRVLTPFYSQFPASGNEFRNETRRCHRSRLSRPTEEMKAILDTNVFISS